MIAVARAHGMMVMVGCMIESSLGITAAAHFTPLVDIVDLDGAALLANDPFIGARIDGGQVTLPDGPGLGVTAAMTDRFAQVALPLPLATPVHLPHSRDAGRPGGPGRARRRAGSPPRADRHRRRGRREPPPGRAEGRAGRPRSPSRRCPAALLETARMDRGLLRRAARAHAQVRCCPAGMWGESQVVVVAGRSGATRPRRRWRGRWSAWLERRGGEAPVPTAARALKRPLWEVLERLARVRAVDAPGRTARHRGGGA